MTGDPRRARVSDRPRSATGREWEVFVRPESADALRHVGSVTAGDAEDAHAHAARLFGRDANDVWLCPAEAVVRYAAETLDDRADPAPVGACDDSAEPTEPPATSDEQNATPQTPATDDQTPVTDDQNGTKYGQNASVTDHR